MVEKYKVTLSIIVLKGANEEAMVEESFFFNEMAFSKMANVSDEFYEIITKLQKIK